MAKIRVYELARDLNMTNKELIEKLNDFGFSILTHTNSLEPEEVAEFRNKLNKKPANSVEETRVRPTVIRRRRKAKEETTEEVSKPIESETPPATKTTVAEESEDDVIAEEATTSEVEPIAEDPVVDEEAQIEIQEEIETPAPVKKVAKEKTKKEDTVAVADETAKDLKTETKPKKEETPAKPAAKKRRSKKDRPAKIIKAAPQPTAAELAKKADAIAIAKAKATKSPADNLDEAKIPVKKSPLKPETEKPKKLTGKEKKKKGGKKVTDSAEEELKTPKKKSSFRKKAVVEGEDLYSKDTRARKHRKGDKGKKAAKGQKPQITTPKAIKRRIKIDDTIVLSELAKRMGIKANEIIGKLMGLGVMATVNQAIDYDTATLVASDFEYEVERAGFEEKEFLHVKTEDPPDKLSSRPPVVTVMGHVDHGKTSLLDMIRKTSVTEKEAGGITQHIGAYNVHTEKGQIVFLDTPGHEAFTAMRSRGASITDIVILVVAADDGVMPQTIEAINHSKAAEVPIIVAINKIDKPNAEPDRVQRELAEVGLTPEDWGGDTIFMKVSAKQGDGIEDLLEMVLLQAELLELKANPNKLASGHVVEAQLDAGRGAVATVLVQDGTLRAGEPVVCGLHYGRIRALLNDRGQQVESAGPSIPVEIIGISGVPNAGDEFVAVADEKSARQVSQNRMQKQRSKELARTNRLNLDNFFEHLQEGEIKDLNLILKADVNGSIEALKDSLDKLSNEEVKINVIHSATGAISEHDVALSAVSDAIIIGFNVRPNTKVQALAVDENVSIRYYNIIYNVIQDVQNAILGLMASTFEEKTTGNAEVREVFHVPKVGAIAGSYITDGKIQRSQKVRLVRDGVVLYDGKIDSLRRFKDDVREVATGFECGISIENYNDIKIGDVIEGYVVEEIKPHL